MNFFFYVTLTPPDLTRIYLFSVSHDYFISAACLQKLGPHWLEKKKKNTFI